MDIEFSKLSINNCDICNNILTNTTKNICNDCSDKIRFLYEDDIVNLNCIYCQFYTDYKNSYICSNCQPI
jgi:hypothetical protein